MPNSNSNRFKSEKHFEILLSKLYLLDEDKFKSIEVYNKMLNRFANETFIIFEICKLSWYWLYSEKKCWDLAYSPIKIWSTLTKISCMSEKVLEYYIVILEFYYVVSTIISVYLI